MLVRSTEDLIALVGNEPRIALFRPSPPEEMVPLVPALRALRASLPHAHFTVIGSPSSRDFITRFPQYIDDFIEFPGFPGVGDYSPDLAKFPDFLRNVRARRFNFVFQMHGNGVVVNQLRDLIAPQGAGYSLEIPSRDEFSLFDSSNAHEIDRLLTLVRGVGVPSKGRELEFPLSDEDERAARRLIGRLHSEPFLFVASGRISSSSRAQWIAVLQLLEGTGIPIVRRRSDEERDGGAQGGDSGLGGAALHLTGRVDLGSLGAIVRRATLVVSDDPFVSQLSYVFGVPSVSLVNGAHPRRWGAPPSLEHLHACVSIARHDGEWGAIAVQRVQELLQRCCRRAA